MLAVEWEASVALAHTVVGEDFEVHFSWDGDILAARVTGPHDSLAISRAYWKVIATERARIGAKRLLVLEELEETAASEMVLQLFEHLLKLELQGSRVAFVDAVDSQRSEQEHVAILARERGIVAAIFSDENEARTWLRHGEA